MLHLPTFHVLVEAPKEPKPLIDTCTLIDPKALAQSLKENINHATEGLIEKSWNYRKTGVTGDDIADAAASFLPSIQEIAGINHPDDLETVYDLVIFVKDVSAESVNSLGGRDTMDARLNSELKYLEAQAQGLGEYGVEPWYEESRKLLAELAAAADKLTAPVAV
ncbi:hypothetical protein QBC44DRAFT_391697 [Cladorrhinum sp. PSN332]|nr:hypothetical protein QBC44DRAFT_391697 [Cladorrhinum sp. PSN332]